MTNLSASPTALMQHRQQFPALANKHYFNFGGQGPLPQPSLTAIQQAYAYLQQEGPFSGQALAWISQQVTEVRAAIAQELNTTPATITLTESVSVGCNIPLWGLNWQPGDHILLSDCEHPGIVATVQQLQQRFGITFSTCPILETLNQGDPVAVVRAALQPKTRLVVISHVLWNTGQVLPLADIVQTCHDHMSDRSVLVLVDAAQSVGVLPLDLPALGVDFYAFTGHKWMCGPEGIGGLYMRPEVLDRVHPTYIGWRSIELDSQGDPAGWKPDGRRFEVATSAFPLCAGLTAAIALHNQWGNKCDRYARIRQLAQLLWRELDQLPRVHCLRSAPPEAGLISFQVADYPHQQLVKDLEARRFQVRLIANPNCVRACVHYLTLESEITDFIATLKELFA